MTLNLLLAFSMIFIANKTREIEKNNYNLSLDIQKINENIKINKIELITHQNTSYLKKLFSLYISETQQINQPKIISLNQLSTEIKNIELVNINK